ncbi:hypothetical protein [Pseudomonas rhodesiae]|uniref:hypothetical protein n=1 Tax=Pseudomonas rhodesiae TaxID=76760 RepID=UPI0032B2B54F
MSGLLGRRQWRGIAGTNPYNAATVLLSPFRLAIDSVKSSFYPFVHFSTARIRQYFAVIQQMDALKAQENTRFEEIHRDT